MFIVALVVIAMIAIYLYNIRNFNYWKDRGIKHDKPILFFGNNVRNLFLKKSITEMFTEIYVKYPEEKVVGFFRSSSPDLIVRDPEIIKRILVTDFIHFSSRGLNQLKEQEPMLRNLFFADGDMWRLLRQRMTPAFTSGKLRAMFPLIVERAEKLQARALAAASAGRSLDARDLMARYTTDFIGACGFGLDADSLSDDNSAFRELGAKIFKISFTDAIILKLKQMFPRLFKDIHIFRNVESELVDLVGMILKKRNYQPSGRNDFVDLLLEAKSKGAMIGESIEKKTADGTPETVTIELDEVLMTAQVFIFFAAGFETSSSATSFTLHQLAYHPEVQNKLQKDIDRILAKHDNKLSYESIKEMTYLNWAFKEGMRMFPSLGFLTRICVGTYTIPEIGVTIDSKVHVIVPLQALHNDPKYFDNPDEFRPERFHPDSFDSAALKHLYLPFGEGPRACIGERLGQMQSLAGLAAILSRFTVEPAPESLRRPRVNPPSGIVQNIKGGLPLMFKERKINSYC